MFILCWILFEYSGYRAFYFCCTIYIYIFTYIHQIYFGRFAAWITYSLFTPQYALFLAYKLKYRNFNSTFCMYAYYFLLHTFAGVERFARLQILYYLLYFMYAFLLSTVILLIVSFFLSLCTLKIYMHTVRACSITYLFIIFFMFSISTVILILLFLIYVFLYIYMYWALHTFHYLLMCYVPLSCFL